LINWKGHRLVVAARRSGLPLVLAAALAGLGCDSGNQHTTREFVVDESSVIVTTESGLLAMPFDVAVDDEGWIYVLDWQDARLLVFGRDGQYRATLGTEGAGPGELRRPTRFWIDGDTLRIVDAGNGRLQLWDRNGEFLNITNLPREATRGVPISMWPNGRIVVATRGRDSALAKVVESDGELLRRIGTPFGPPVRYRGSQMRAIIASGEIPASFQNTVLPVAAKDGGVWLIPLGKPIVQRYDSMGTLRWTVGLDIPEKDIIEQSFFEANGSNDNPNVIISMRYVADAVAIGGALWLLLDLPRELATNVLVLSDDGQLRDRIRFDTVSDATSFAVDLTRQRILFVIGSEATVRIAPLPSGI